MRAQGSAFSRTASRADPSLAGKHHANAVRREDRNGAPGVVEALPLYDRHKSDLRDGVGWNCTSGREANERRHGVPGTLNFRLRANHAQHFPRANLPDCPTNKAGVRQLVPRFQHGCT